MAGGPAFRFLLPDLPLKWVPHPSRGILREGWESAIHGIPAGIAPYASRFDAVLCDSISTVPTAPVE
jgi:hypothetical protein